MQQIVTREEFASVILEAGYSKPFIRLQMDDVPDIKQILRNFTMVNVKAEIDQFSEGLEVLGSWQL